ncbi:MAG: NCS2 family permease [Elusimicrobiota bacterium]
MVSNPRARAANPFGDPRMKSQIPPLRTELLAGLTTFLTMSYIVVVNPSILSSPGTGIPFSGALSATVLLACLMTLMMGLYADLPFAVAPGMGINAFFTYTLILGQGVPWPTALGIVFWAGVIFLAVSITPLRENIARAVPKSLRLGAASGIGIFLTFIGLKNAGFISADPVTFVKAGSLGTEALLSLGGLAVIIAFMRRRSPLAFLAGIASVTVAAWVLGLTRFPDRLISPPDFESVFFRLDIMGALKPALLPAILSLFFTDLFDSISTFIGVAHAANLLDEDGQPRNLRQGLIVDAFATLGAGLLGTSSGTAYIESSAGIEMGGRTGRTAVAAAACFLPCLFLAPLAAMVPSCATAPVLILVGSFMFKSVRELPVTHLEDSVPAFLTVILIPLTFSITQGILWGFISHVALYALAGRRREIAPMMWVLASISASLLAIERVGAAVR